MKAVKIGFFLLSSILITTGPLKVKAQDSDNNNDWQYALELYGWGASVGGSSASGSEIDIELDDILDSLEFAFMGAARASKGKWLVGADVIYMAADSSGDIAPGLRANVDVTNWIITPLVGYNVVDKGRGRLDVLAGARYLYMKADLGVEPLGLRASDSRSNWDAVIGVKGDLDLVQNWYLYGYLDIGTGDSDLTWQGAAGIGYRFKWFSVNLDYRYLTWDFDDNMAVDDLNISGPGLGFRFVF